MNPFFVLLGMYTGFAAALFASGYVYKTTRDRRNKANEEQEKQKQRNLDFEQNIKDAKPQRQHTVGAR